jgi:hypothetical protein
VTHGAGRRARGVERGATGVGPEPRAAERGAMDRAVELLVVFLTLLVPLVYVMVVMADVQRALLATSSAAREAGRVYVTGSDRVDAERRAGVAYREVLATYEMGAGDARAGMRLQVGCPAGVGAGCAGGFGPGAEVPRCRCRPRPDGRGDPPHPGRPLPRAGRMSPPGRPDATGAAGSPRAREEGGQALVLLIGLVVLVLMVLALGWDTSNWFLGHRALANLADGAAVAAANDVDTRAWYLSGGRSVRVAEERARATVVAYLAGSAGDSGIAGARLGSVEVVPGEGGPEVTVRVTAPARAGLLRLLHLIPPEMEGRAAATARLVPP